VKRDMLYHRLLEALGERGCPVCYIRNDATHRYLRSLLYEQVNAPDLRQSLIQSKGFCRPHAWALSRAGDILGITILYRDQVEEAIRDLHRTLRALDTGRRRNLWQGDGTRRKTIGAFLRQQRTPGEPCPPCRIGKATAERTIVTLISHLDDSVIQRALDQSAFLCLPDLETALEHTRTREQAQRLLDLAEMKLKRLEEELAELIRKQDYLFLNEPRGDEQTAWLRAIGQLVGWPREEVSHGSVY
jgi:hypothetical protein